MNTNRHFLKLSRKQKRAGAHQKSRKFSALSGSILKLAASVLLLGAASLPAAVVYWDADGTAIGNNSSSGAGLGGSGTWNPSNSNWWDGFSPSDAAFPGTGTDTAIFTGTGGIVQLGSAITVQTLTFNSDGFTITGGTGGTNALTLASSNAINVNVAGTATVSAVVAGSGGLTLNSATTGTLALTGVNTYTGLTTVNGGILSVASSGNLNSGNDLTVGALGKATFDNGSQDLGTVLNSGRVDFTDTGGTITLGPVTNGGSGIMNFAGGTNTLGAVSNGGVMNFTNVGAVNTLASLTGAGATNFSGYTIITGQFDTGTATFGGTGEIGTAASGTLYMNGFSNKITTLNGGTTVIFGSAPNSYGLLIPVDLTVHEGSAAGAISGDGSLTVTGSLTLSGNNTYTLGTTVDGGVLLVGNGGTSGTLGTGAVILNNNATLAFNRSDNYGGAVSNNINGAGGVTLNAGTLALTGSNGYTGPTTLNGGTLQVGNGGTSGTLGTGAVILNNNATLAFNRSDNYGGAVSNNINGAGGVTLNAGTLALTGSNGYTGPTTLNGGILVMTSASQIGSAGPINFSGGQLQASGTFTLGNAIHVTTTTSGVIVDENETLTLNGNITGRNSLLKQGPGLLVLTGTTDATTVVNAGSVSVTSASAGTSLTVNSGADVTFNQPAGGGTYSNPISGAGDVTVIGALTLAGNGNGFTGNLTIATSTTTASAVTVASPSNLGGAEVQLTSTTTTTPATLQITGGGIYSNPITVGDGITTGVTGRVIFPGNVAVTFSGTLNKNGTTFELVGNNSLGGTVTITGQITGNTGSLNSDMSYNGGTFNLTGTSPNTYFGPTYLTNAVTVNANKVGALPTLNGRSPVLMDQTGSGSSNLVLGANQSIAALTGATSSSVNLNGKTLTIGTDSGSTTFAGAISGAGGLIKDGASTQVLSGANASYTGSTTVNAGTLVLNYSTNNDTKLSSSAVLTLGSATLQLTGGTQTEVVGSTTISGGANVIGNNTSSATNGGGSANTASNTSAVLQMASITRNPGGTVNFSGQYIATTNTLNNTTTGLLGSWATIGGTDFAINQNNTANGWIVNYTGYTLVPRLNGTSQVINDGSVTNVQIVEGASGISNPITLGSAVTTINTLNQSASGGTSAATIDLAGQTLAVNGILAGADGAGSLTIGTGSGSNLGTLKAATPGGELVLNNYSAAAPGLIINSVIANNTSASSLTHSGTGTTQLTAANTYTGMTTVNGGELDLNTGGGQAIAGNLTVTGGTAKLLQVSQINTASSVSVSGGTFDINSNSQTLAGVQLTGGSIIGTSGVLTSTGTFDMQNGSVSAILAGSVGLTKTSDGTVTLSAANTYTGQTNVTAGTLTTSGTMVTTAVSVSSGASFTGTNTGANSAMATNAAVTNNGAMSLAASQTISTLNGATTGATLAAARGRTLNITGGGTYAGAINDVSGTGTGANLTAGGSLTLQGNNGYTGATVVSAGATLAVTGSGAVAGTSSVTVNSGATLQLNAAATNAVNSGAAYVSNGGTLSIGLNLQTLASMTLGSAASSTLNFNNVAGTLSFGSLDGSTKTALSSSPITLNIDNWVGSAYTIGTSSVTLDPSQSSFIFSNDPGFTLGQVIPGVYFAGYGPGMEVTVQVAGGGTAYQIVPATVVPEPATAALLGSVALCALIGCRKRRRSPGF